MTLYARNARDWRRSLPAEVIADGVDVSFRCRKVDTRRRRVWLLAVDAEGHVRYDISRDDAMCEERRVKQLQVTRRQQLRHRTEGQP